MTFKELGLNASILEAISFMGFEKTTPVQEKAIPVILQNKDLMASAQTGTGKTAAFILPILQKLNEERSLGIDTLIVVPTRELAVQIEQEIQGFAYFTNVTSIAVYGGGSGQDFDSEKKAIIQGTNIVVATPGKLISHMNMDYADFSKVRYLILDEADRMLDMGFFDDIRRIVKQLTNRKQTLLFSATMPPKIRKLAKSILNNPEEVRLAVSKPPDGVIQAAYLVREEHKVKLVQKLIDQHPNYESILVFTSTKKKVQSIVKAIAQSGNEVKSVSSDLVQKEREATLQKFKAKQLKVLVATDVLSRGIDIKEINLVINYDVPGDAEDYVHRVGRTARADATGLALTLINEEDMYKFLRIERLIEIEIRKLNIPKEIGESPEWNPKPIFKKSFGRGKSGGSRGPERKKFGSKKKFSKGKGRVRKKG